jgi:cytidylate kinase
VFLALLQSLGEYGNNIFLVGMPGAGKTTVGRHLARRMQRRFIDADHEIEARTGVRIPHIFDIEGEQGFRDRESKVICRTGSAIRSGRRHRRRRGVATGKSRGFAPGRAQ